MKTSSDPMQRREDASNLSPDDVAEGAARRAIEDAPIIVQKYGGSSVADPERLAQVAERVARTVGLGYRVVVVVSAMGKTTDQLLALARSVSPTPPRRELDMLLSTGERISMSLLAMALDRLSVEAISFTGSQSGILTNDRHSGARIIEVRPVRILDELDRGKVVIVAGFQGMSYRREITTLGRGGSDTTAVALAAALRAEHCEICSDVDGVYTADPRVVPGAARVPAIAYEVMQELAEHGAKVLHAQAVEWARKAGIVIHARATSSSPARRGESAEGTRIGALAPDAPSVGVLGAENPQGAASSYGVAVAGTRRLLRARLPRAASDGNGDRIGDGTHDGTDDRNGPAGDVGAELLGWLSSEGVALRRWSEGDVVEAVFSPDDLPDLPRMEASLRARFPGLVLDETGSVTLVGPGVGSDPGRIARAREAVARAGGRVSACEATPLRITLELPSAEVDAATRAVHDALIV